MRWGLVGVTLAESRELSHSQQVVRSIITVQNRSQNPGAALLALT